MAQRRPQPDTQTRSQTDSLSDTPSDTTSADGETSAGYSADSADADTGALGDTPSGGEPDYYAVLGITPSASEVDLRHAYRRLAKLWHPDRYTTAPADLRARAERRMRAITRAYATLSDPLRRHEYDERRPWTADDEAASQAARGANAGPQDGYIPHDPRDPFTPMHHVLGTRPLRVETGYDVSGHASRNPNGAGQFFGMLGLILGLALFLGALNGGANSSAPFILVGILGVIALVVLAGFFLPGTPLARAATAWMEREPRGFTPHTRTPRQTPNAKRAQPTQRPADTPASGADTSSATDEITPQAFEGLVDEAVASLPDEFYAYMENVLVRVEQKPDAATLRKMQVPPNGLLLGLYSGVPLTHHTGAGNSPEIITIYRGPITQICRNDPDRIRAQVRATVLHELAHHFGIDHDGMPEWVK